MNHNTTESSVIPIRTLRERFRRKRITCIMLFCITIILIITIPTVIVLVKNESTTKTSTTYTISTDSTSFVIPTSTIDEVSTDSMPSVIQTSSRLTITTLTKEQMVTSVHNDINVKWMQNAMTVAGGHGRGDELKQLANPYGIDILQEDNDQLIYVTDYDNHRIMEWRSNAIEGRVIAGGNYIGSSIYQLNQPTDVVFDEKDDSLIICDKGNRRIVRWFRQKHTTPQIIISYIDCWSLAIDSQRNLYVVNYGMSEIRRYSENDTDGTLITNGYNNTDRFNQPSYIFIDKNDSIYLSDWGNHQVIKQMKDMSYNSIVAGGHGFGNDSKQLIYPQGIFVDDLDNVYVVDGDNSRIMRWCKECEKGEKVIGGNGFGILENQLNGPKDMVFDRENNIYVVDKDNHRVQKFSVDVD
ncbi:hypothetical protein I4U23_016140 [Adineta vaga]|nr:hypothetical protein I4U23_016140 [Adineta vaga]